MTMEEIRKEFPQLSQTVYGKPLVYLDNAATSLRPRAVMDSWNVMAREKNANLHRAVHYSADIATAAYEYARDAVKDFIGAQNREEIIFTSGTTHSINLAASSFCEAFLRDGDEILVDEDSHHSNIIPWQLAAKRRNAVVKHFNVGEDIADKLSDRTAIVALTHVSNVLGTQNPVREIVSECHKKGVKVLVDGAQGVVHDKVDVVEMDCDFYAFSGHKMYAATGTGVLYGKKELLEQMPPFMGGGEMVGTVGWGGTTYAALPAKFEAGTQNFLSVPTFVEAISVLKAMRCPEIEQNMSDITEYMLDVLPSIGGLKLYGVPSDKRKKIPLFSFSIDGVHHEDLALILDKMGIAVRSGQMCAEPLMDKYGVTGMLRASFAPYNTFEEAGYFVKSLEKAVSMLR